MLPQILQQISASNPRLSQIKQIAQTLRGDPRAMLQSNPQAQKILSQYGGDPEKAFRGYAQQMGVDADEVMRLIKMVGM